MPYKSARPCRYPGCPNLVRDGSQYCPPHQKEKDAAYEAKRGTPSQRGYDHRWRRLRNAYLAQYPFCEDPYGRHKLPVMASEVDHKTPIKDGGGRLDWDNLQSLCKTCHSTKTAKEDGRWG